MPHPAPPESESLREIARSLVDTEVAPWASLYMPIDRIRNRIQLRDLLGQLRDEASLVGLDAEEVDLLLDPAEDLLVSAWESEHRNQSVALFLTTDADEDTLVDLPFAPPLRASFDTTVHLGPLWRGVEPEGRFYILSLWRGGAKLHRASRYGMQVIPSRDGPSSLDAVLRTDTQTQRVLNRPRTSRTSTTVPSRRPVEYRSHYSYELRGNMTSWVS